MPLAGPPPLRDCLCVVLEKAQARAACAAKKLTSGVESAASVRVLKA